VSVRGAAFIGIGSMVGAGIFALLGQAAVIAGSAVWLSFLLAGGVTMLLAYNVVKLGIRYPSQGGLIEYLRQGFGNGRLLGIAAWLGYVAAFVVVVAMLAVSFGAYAVSLFLGDGAWSGWDNVFASLVIVAMTFINMIGTTFVSRVASLMVVVLLGVFSVFIVVTIKEVNFDLLAVSGYPSFSKIIASIALTFFAFLGFGVMTFTVASLRDPKRELPRAVALWD
jgi:amino acid transporter